MGQDASTEQKVEVVPVKLCLFPQCSELAGQDGAGNYCVDHQIKQEVVWYVTQEYIIPAAKALAARWWTQPQPTSNQTILREFKNVEAQVKPSDDTAVEDSEENQACIICMERAVKICLLPCRHASFCITCSLKMQECSVCRSGITSRLRIFTR